MTNQKVEKAHKKLMDRISSFAYIDSLLSDVIKKSLQNMYDLGYGDGYAQGMLESHANDDFNDDFIN